MSGILALVYASRHSVRGVVTVDQPWNVRPFVEILRHVGPALRGNDFSTAFAPFEQSIGVHRLAPDIRADVVARRRVDRDLVLGYWAEVLDAEPDELQSRIDGYASLTTAPCLAVFGDEVSVAERRRMANLVPAVEITEWADGGHMVHLIDAERFAARLRAFINECTSTGGSRQ
jgi:pimeloyl-ACP methyl ester carboxylesterase